MALTKQWTSFTDYLILVSIGNGAYRQQLVMNAPVAGATLLRTRVTSQMTVLVPTAGVAPPTSWWSTSDCEVRAIHSPTGADPLPTRNVHDPGDVGRVPLRARGYPSPLGAPEYHVLFDEPEPIDTPSMRKSAPGDTPAVWIYLYYFDQSHALNGAYNPGISVVITADVLWGY